MMKYSHIKMDSDVELSFINSSFARYKSIIQEQFALAKNNIPFEYTDGISYKERQFFLEVLQEFQDAANSN